MGCDLEVSGNQHICVYSHFCLLVVVYSVFAIEHKTNRWCTHVLIQVPLFPRLYCLCMKHVMRASLYIFLPVEFHLHACTCSNLNFPTSYPVCQGSHHICLCTGWVGEGGRERESWIPLSTGVIIIYMHVV